MKCAYPVDCTCFWITLEWEGDKEMGLTTQFLRSLRATFLPVAQALHPCPRVLVSLPTLQGSCFLWSLGPFKASRYSSEHFQGWSVEREKDAQKTKQKEFLCAIAD